MRAVVIQRYGTPDVLELRDLPRPTPRSGEVIVRVVAASVNDWDLAMVLGKPAVARLLHGLFRPKVPVLGCDIAGRVEAVGEGVRELRPGDEVYGDLCTCGFGAFAEYACAPAAGLGRKPPGMTFEQAAAIPQAGMLAVQGLIDVGGIRSGQRVLLNGAGGGVGTFALQIARLWDVEVTAVDKEGKLDLLRAMGADRAFDYRERDFVTSGERWDLILDVVTNRSPLAYARALHPGGTYATVGGDTSRLLQTGVVGPLLSWRSKKRVRVVALKPNKDLAWVNEQFEAGRLVPVIDRRYGLAELADAMRYFATGDHLGKIIVTME